jgi:type II secretory pathway component PulF
MSPSVVEAIRSGERSGQLAPVLLMVADALDEDNEVVVKTLTSILEPVILIVLGLVVGAVAISMFLPLFDLTAGTAPGGAP